MTLSIESPVFAEGGTIPARYTCEGDDVSPPLAWSGVPAGTKSCVLIIEDPDAPDPRAPKTIWVHWILYNLPPTLASLEEDVVPSEALAGLNDWGRARYGGPCPPIGRHRYLHRLFALDTRLPDMPEPRKAAIEKAMRGHILAEAVLVGTYEKSIRR